MGAYAPPLVAVIDTLYLEGMSQAMTVNVRVDGALGDFVAANVGANGTYDDVGEYVRDLVRRDKERIEAERLDHLKAELRVAFATAETAYLLLDAETVIARNART